MSKATPQNNINEKQIKLTPTTVYRGYGDGDRIYEAEEIPTNRGRNRWNVTVVDLERDDAARFGDTKTLYRVPDRTGEPLIWTMDQAVESANDYERRAVKRDAARTSDLEATANRESAQGAPSRKGLRR